MIRAVNVIDREFYYSRLNLVIGGPLRVTKEGGRFNSVVLFDGEDYIFSFFRETDNHPPFSKLRRGILGVSMEVLSGAARDYSYVSPGRRNHD